MAIVCLCVLTDLFVRICGRTDPFMAVSFTQRLFPAGTTAVTALPMTPNTSPFPVSSPGFTSFRQTASPPPCPPPKRLRTRPVGDDSIDPLRRRQPNRLQFRLHPAPAAPRAGAPRHRIRAIVDAFDPGKQPRFGMQTRIAIIQPVDIGKNHQPVRPAREETAPLAVRTFLHHLI